MTPAGPGESPREDRNREERSGREDRGGRDDRGDRGAREDRGDRATREEKGGREDRRGAEPTGAGAGRSGGGGSKRYSSIRQRPMPEVYQPHQIQYITGNVHFISIQNYAILSTTY